ncbi:MAG: outer membrane beta-barrel protein [Chitinophagaceae bacterium]
MTVIPEKQKASFGICFAPEYNLIGLTSEKRSVNFPDKTKGRFGYSAGLSFRYMLSKTLSFKTSVSYEMKQCDFMCSGLTLKQDYDTILHGYTSTSSQITAYKLQEIDIPLLFSFDDKKNRIFLNIGVDFAYVYKNQTARKYVFGKGGEEEIILQNSTLLNVGSVLGFGFNVRSQKKTFLTVEYFFKIFYKKYGLPSLNESGQMINLGLKTSWYFIH